MKKRVLFYSSVSNKELFNIQQFYVVDINILKDLGFEVLLSNKISDAFKFWNYDFVFAYFYKYAFFVALIAKIFCRNTYFTGGIDSLDRSLAKGKELWLQRVFFFLCNIIGKKCIIVSPTDMENAKRCSLFRKKLEYSEHTIDVKKFISEVPKENLATTIVWQGTIANVKRKGVDNALILFSKLINSPQYKDYKFYIVGKTGAGTEYIKSLIHELGIEHSVVITDSISEKDKISLLKRSRYYFQLSVYEGFGLAALEALCAGNILIHSGRGGLANPIYKSCIKLNITDDIKNEFVLKQKIDNFDMKTFNEIVSNVQTNYCNERRKREFEQIIIE